MLRLYRNDEWMGDVTPTYREHYWTYGTIRLTPAGERLSGYFRFMTDHDRVQAGLPEEYAALFRSGGWFMVDEEGRRIGIDAPAIHEDGEIAWVFGGRTQTADQ
jgi:hypothetical protein